ncbi:MAG: radical SAM protein [Myxococcota bacterium]
MTRPFRLTLIHPCIGRRVGERYIRSWQMQPLPPAVIAGLTPSDVDVRFYDDRLEVIPYDEPSDLVALSVETYTAKRAYQIATEYRRRGVPVVMGGFHASLVPDEVSEYAESVVVGEAEELWPRIVDDYRHGRPEKIYRAEGRPSLARATPDRRIFQNKRYLPIGLIEAGRGCQFNCEFCAIQTVFQRSQTRRPFEAIVAELEAIKGQHKLVFFVDDNIASDLEEGKELLRVIKKAGVRWVSQMSLNAAHDEEYLDLLNDSGCAGVLIGFESLNVDNLARMGKSFNAKQGGFEAAVTKLRQKRIRLYVTFVFGYDEDTPESFTASVRFAKEHGFYITAFNHLTPFPGTPLYERLAREGRLLYDKWWLDPRYSYNRIPFQPKGLSPDELQRHCVQARTDFYSVPSILRRSCDRVNRGDFFMWRNFFLINAMHRAEVSRRDFYPLGDETWQGELLRVS